jgi:acyl-CoA oxidase
MAAEEAFSTVAGVELAEAGRAHARLLLAAAFYRAVSASAAPAPVVVVLWRLCALHAAGELAAHSCLPLLETKWMGPADPAATRAAVSRLLSQLRPDAVALVDAFGMSDWELSSVLGRRDGGVYTHLLAWARRSPLNRTERMEAFEKHVRPRMGHEAAGSITSKL